VATGPRYPDVSLSVVMPAYNEAANVDATIPKALAALRELVGTFELIVIDDASTDDTLLRAQRLADGAPELVLVSNDENLRQGGSLRKGFALARHDLVTHNAMDYPFDYRDLPTLLERLPDADVIVARRRTYPGTSSSRRAVSWVNRRLLRLLFHAPVNDYNFVQVYRRAVLESQPSRSEATSFITAEKIIRAAHAGWRVVEVEVPYHPRVTGRASSANYANIKRALLDMARLRWALWRRR
jgi:glycosyltransferase involved in cell wall biosynthesis